MSDKTDYWLDNFLRCDPLTDDVYASILDARREDAESQACNKQHPRVSMCGKAIDRGLDNPPIESVSSK